MRLNKMIYMVLACTVIVGLVSFPVNAVEVETTTSERNVLSFIIPRATGSFSMSIPANNNLIANSSFPLVAGETITIKASYAPFDASVDFGVIAPDGKYYYFNVTNGSIDKTIQVSISGSYTLMVRNNSDNEVEVSGFVQY